MCIQRREFYEREAYPKNVIRSHSLRQESVFLRWI
ncbi:hypothetical protein Gogos_022338 [Gossypium gossypioides]|uniref:Uncharacterized protein n=1 Tax=Gossypium gossypioides TaxID=34282 RepID=A0A7J9D6J3_GOSGO|nr:hypothetical protein [Gossypium gossypioides]